MTIRTTTVFETEDGKTHKTESEAVMHALDVIGKDILKNHANGSIRAGLLHHASALIPLLLFVRDELRNSGEHDDDKEGESKGSETIPAVETPEYWQGHDAFLKGAQLFNNPFDLPGHAYEEWRRGWTAGLNADEHPSRP